MNPEDCCADCRAIIEAPNVNHEPHDLLRQIGEQRTGFRDGREEFFEERACDRCGARFEHLTSAAPDAVPWRFLG